jgi:uncharacterized phiE125 gp8 family phage protein
MRIVKVSGGTGTVISLEDAKKHLRVNLSESYTVEDADINAMIEAALDVAESETGLVLRPTVFAQYFDNFTETFNLLKAPVTTITSFQYLNESDEWDNVPADDYEKDIYSTPARIYMKDEPSDVDSDVEWNKYKVTFTAGYATADDIPAAVISGIKMVIAHLYENRADVISGKTAMEIPQNSKYLFQKYRVYNV